MVFFQKIQHFLSCSGLMNSIATLVCGTALGHAVTLIVAPLLTRLYSPEDFGVLGLFMSCLSILSVVGSLCYQEAILLPEADTEAFHLLVFCVGILFSMGCIVFFSICSFHEQLVRLFQLEKISTAIYLLPVGLVSIGGYNLLNYWAVRKRAFTAIARTKIMQSGNCAIFQTLGGLFSFGGVPLIIGDIIGRSSGILSFLQLMKKEGTFKNIQFPKKEDLKKVALDYRDFPRRGILKGIVNSAETAIPIFLFSIFLSPAQTGFYILATRVLSVPSALVGRAIGQACYPHSIEAYKTGSLNISILKMLTALISASAFPFTLIAVFAPSLSLYLFGEEWQQAGKMMSWLCLSSFFSFIFSPMSQVFVVMRRLDLSLYYHSSVLLLRIIGFFVSFFVVSAQDVIIGYSFFCAVGSIVGICILLRLSNVAFKDTVLIISKNMIPVIFLAPVFFVQGGLSFVLVLISVTFYVFVFLNILKDMKK